LYIDNQESLEETIAIFSKADFLTIDTEFMHERTYYPKLCLLQVASDDLEVIIDPLAPLDLTSLTKILTDQDITKVFHAGDQDRIILYQMISAPVSPVFDLQRAVLLLGLSQQMSLASLVKHYCDVNLKKDESFSDWSQRPLTTEQMNYAINDVHYLPYIYRTIVQELEENGRLHWLDDDFAAMGDESLYAVDSREVWKKLKSATSLKGQQLAIAREVCSWRELTAQRRNTPRKWILPDELIIEICRRAPASVPDLLKIRGMKNHMNSQSADQVLEAVAIAKQLPPVTWPKNEKFRSFDSGLSSKLDLLNSLLHLRSKELHIASSFLTNHSELVRLACGQRTDLPLLSGWRKELIGDELVSLLEGKLALSLEGDDLKVTLLPQPATSSAH